MTWPAIPYIYDRSNIVDNVRIIACETNSSALSFVQLVYAFAAALCGIHSQ
jgi:hypothetical protein